LKQVVYNNRSRRLRCWDQLLSEIGQWLSASMDRLDDIALSAIDVV
jgi:hypothetical protein